jgi:SAC3/GANP family
MIPEDYRFCSKEEVDERQRTGEIHILEATIETADSRLLLSSRLIDRSRAVRKFVRSGSSDLQKRYLSRTPDQLHATTHYLICNIWHRTPPLRCNSGCSVSSTYAFVMDRLLAVRQEITSLSLSSSDPLFAVSLLKSMVHFYINSMHVLTSLSTENSYLSDADMSTAGQMLLGSKDIRLPSLGSWFDLHLHENALSSCLKSALGLCCHIPREQQSVFHSNRDELSAYFLLLSAAQELRKYFDDVYFNKGNSSTNMKQTVRLSAMKELFSQRVALVPNNLIGLRTLHCLDSVLNLDPQDASHSDIATESSAKGPLLAHIALKCVRCIRQGNSAGAVRAFSPIASYSLRKHDTNTSGGHVHKIRLRQRLMLGSLLHHLLPELRLLRLMQCDVAVTKNCEMDMVCISNENCYYLIMYHSLF